MLASVSVLAANDFALLKLDERCRSPLVGSLTDRLGIFTYKSGIQNALGSLNLTT